MPFTLTWHASHSRAGAVRRRAAILETGAGGAWSKRCTYEGEWRETVMRSLITLKALTFGPTGGVVAAPTTSLPEELGGVRNWDYRYCWLRDATFTFYALAMSGYDEEAAAWRQWLLRAAAGNPSDLQIMYGLGGERRLTELELPWLPGYEGARPVRIGNAASRQLQLDVYGEVMDALHAARRTGNDVGEPAWAMQRAMMKALESTWEQPDEGIWEVRGPRPLHALESWQVATAGPRGEGVSATPEARSTSGGARDRIHEEVCRRG